MIEKYAYIDKELAHGLIDAAKERKYDKRGFDRRTFLLGDYAVLRSERIKRRNVDTMDSELRYFDEIIETLKGLYDRGIATTPILGYCCDDISADGEGYIIQMRAKGQEVYDDAVMARYQAWTQNPDVDVYLTSPLNDQQAAEYVVNRTVEIADAAQGHYDRFIDDMKAILNEELLIDFNGQSNFFYDPQAGFSFIDIDSHNDYRYGLTDSKPEVEKLIARGGFVLCHRADSPSALDAKAVLSMGADRLNVIRRANKQIAEKVCLSMRRIGVPKEHIMSEMVKLYF